MICELFEENQLKCQTIPHCFTISNKVVVIVHGFLSHYNRKWLADMAYQIQKFSYWAPELEETATIILGNYISTVSF